MSCWCAESRQARAHLRDRFYCYRDWCGRVGGCEGVSTAQGAVRALVHSFLLIYPSSLNSSRCYRFSFHFQESHSNWISISPHFQIYAVPSLFTHPRTPTWWFSLLCLHAGAKQASPHRYHKAFSTPDFPKKDKWKIKLRSRIYMSDKYTNTTMQANTQKVTVIPPHLRDSLNLCERCVLLSQTSTGFVSMKRSWNSSISGVIWPTVITVQE